MRQLLALFFARNKEYYRDKGSLAWSFIMPPLLIAVVALAFSRPAAPLFKVGVIEDSPLPPALDQPYVQAIDVQSEAKGAEKIRHHQLDLFMSGDGTHYLYNPENTASKVLQDLLRNGNSPVNSEAIAGKPVRYVDWVVPGILAMNMMFSGLYGVGYVIVRYRKNGVLKRLQAAPVAPFNFIAAQLLSRLLIMLATIVVVFAAANFFLDFLMLGSYWSLLLIALLGSVCIVSLGLLVAARTSSEELANGLLNLLTFPMLLLSELWFSLDGAPGWMSSLAQALPLTHVVQAARGVMIDGMTLTDIMPHLGILAGMTLVLLGLATWLFRWQAR